jgi:hypothetical protein
LKGHAFRFRRDAIGMAQLDLPILRPARLVPDVG